MKRLEGT